MTHNNLKAISDWFGSDFAASNLSHSEEKAAALSMLHAAVQLALIEAGRAEVTATVYEALAQANRTNFVDHNS